MNIHLKINYGKACLRTIHYSDIVIYRHHNSFGCTCLLLKERVSLLITYQTTVIFVPLGLIHCYNFTLYCALRTDPRKRQMFSFYIKGIPNKKILFPAFRLTSFVSINKWFAVWIARWNFTEKRIMLLFLFFCKYNFKLSFN